MKPQRRPVCVVGGLPGLNLQVNAAGAWRFGHYIPVAVRRYPFIIMADPERSDTLTLAVEEDTELLDPAAPDKLFENGEMTTFGRERLQFAAQVAGEFKKTETLYRHPALDDLLMPARNVAPPRLAVRSRGIPQRRFKLVGRREGGAAEKD
jgi:SapC